MCFLCRRVHTVYMSNNHEESLGNVCTNCGDDDQFGTTTFALGEHDVCVRCTERVLTAMAARPLLRC